MSEESTSAEQRPNITLQDIASVVDVLKSSYLTQGPIVTQFEEAISDYCGARKAVAVNSATSAMHLACLAFDLKPGDSLWTSPTTFVASANCGRYCRAQIDFVDIDPKTGLMCCDALTEKLRQAEHFGTLPKVVVPVHLAGTSCDMARIHQLSNQYNFFVLEDASHAVGSLYKGSRVGSCKYSDITVFSFHPVKIITSGEGGMALTNNEYYAEKIRVLSSHGITKDPRKFTSHVAESWSYEQQELGMNYRMSDIHAALGLSQLQQLSNIVAERNSLLLFYQKLVRDLPLKFLDIPSQCISSVHLGIVRFQNKSVDFHRYIFEFMRSASIGVQLHYLPVHLQPYYRSLGFKEGDFPEAEKYAHNAMSLPLFPGLTKSEASRGLSFE